VWWKRPSVRPSVTYYQLLNNSPGFCAVRYRGPLHVSTEISWFFCNAAQWQSHFICNLPLFSALCLQSGQGCLQKCTESLRVSSTWAQWHLRFTNGLKCVPVRTWHIY
jgi:hypothetical protein